MNVEITKIVTEYMLSVEPTIVLNGAEFEDGSFHSSGNYEVTSAKVRVTEGVPYVQLFGYKLTAKGMRSKRGEEWVGRQEYVTRARNHESVWSSATTDAIEAAVLEAIKELP